MPIDTYAAINEWEKGGLFIDENLSDEADYSQIHNAVFGCFPAEYMHPGDYKKLHERIADLIDRPTCSIKRGYQTTWGVCSRCGALVNAERAVSTAIEFLPTRYCPWCGKEIEND